MNELIEFIENLTEDQVEKLYRHLPEIRQMSADMQKQTTSKVEAR